MAYHSPSASPLGYVSDGTASASSAEDIPSAAQPTKTYRNISNGFSPTSAKVTTITATHTPPARCSTLGPESVTHPFPSSSNADTTEEENEREGEEDNASTGTETEADDDHPLPLSVTRTLPLLSDVGAALSSSLISSHDASFSNSLLVSQGAVMEGEWMPSMGSYYTTTTTTAAAAATTHSQKQLNSNNSDKNDAANMYNNRSSVEIAHAATAARSSASTAAAAGKDAGVASLEDGATATSSSATSTGDHSLPTAPPPPPPTAPRNGNDTAFTQPRSRQASLSKLSPTSTGLRQRHGPASPAGDVRTLQDLIAWRSHLSDSQRSGETTHHDDESGGHPASCVGSPFSKSVPPPPAMKNIDTSMAFHFPASTPVTPGLWQPVVPPTEATSNAAVTTTTTSTSSSTSSQPNLTKPHRLHAPPSLPSLVGPGSISQLSATAAPRSRHGSQEPIAASQTGGSPCSTSSPLSAHPSSSSHQSQQQPQCLVSNRFSHSELGDLSTSSTATSNLASPASAHSPLYHHSPHPIVSPSETKPRCDGAQGFAPSTPVTTRATTVLDTRHAARENGGDACPRTTSTTHFSTPGSHHLAHHHHHSDTRGSGSNLGSRPAASPASSSSLSGAWGIEDYAPPHARGDTTAQHPCASAACSPFRHHPHYTTTTTGPPRRSSEASTSPRGILPGLLATSGNSAADIVYGSPVGIGHGGAQWGPAGGPLLHRTHSSALSTPQHSGDRGGRDASKQWRGLQAPEEYPAFATPVDEDTNKAVVAFVTALLLLFCLVFIFAV